MTAEKLVWRAECQLRATQGPIGNVSGPWVRLLWDAVMTDAVICGCGVGEWGRGLGRTDG